MKPFEFFEHTADIGVRAYGKSLEELFVNAAHALYEVQGRFEIIDRQQLKFEVTADSTAELLVRWLSELQYQLTTKNIYFRHFKLQFPDEKRLIGQIEGGKISFKNSEVSDEVKAITYHQLEVKQIPEGWMAQVILDV